MMQLCLATEQMYEQILACRNIDDQIWKLEEDLRRVEPILQTLRTTLTEQLPGTVQEISRVEAVLDSLSTIEAGLQEVLPMLTKQLHGTMQARDRSVPQAQDECVIFVTWRCFCSHMKQHFVHYEEICPDLSDLKRHVGTNWWRTAVLFTQVARTRLLSESSVMALAPESFVGTA